MRFVSRASCLAGLGAALLFIAVESCRSPKAARPPVTPAPGVGIELAPPVIRVGLGTDYRNLELTLRSKALVYEGRRREHRLTEISGKVYVELSAETLMEGIESHHWVQVAVPGDRHAAGELAAQLTKETGFKVSVTRSNQVRVGPYATAEEARATLTYLTGNGFPGGLMVEEKRERAAARSFKAAWSGGFVEKARDGIIEIVPETEDPIVELGGKLYRGLLEIRVNKSNRLTVVNVLNLEDYLRGVVPNELSPASFPQIEALKAQAVAARTYALKNMGQFDGFDICATPTCQVYEGASSESPLSDRAVSETAGEVAVYRGQLIDALYTSTCGGSTESAENVFEGRGAPYLRPVPCYPEGLKEFEIRAARSALDDPLALPLAVVRALGIAAVEPADLGDPATVEETIHWIERLMMVCHRMPHEAACPGGPLTLGKIALYAMERLGWGEKLEHLIDRRDIDYVLGSYPDCADLPEAERRALAWLVSEKLMTPHAADKGLGVVGPTRRQVIELIYNLAVSGNDPRRTAVFLRQGEGTVTLQEAGAEQTLPLAGDLSLFERRSPVAGVPFCRMLGGESVQYVPDPDGRVAVLIVDQLAGTANDRPSKYYRWEQRVAFSDLSARLARSYDIGRLIDIEVLATGASGRATTLQVKGTARSVTLAGIRIRWALGLRDNLFVVDRIYDSTGAISAYQFSGRGWGHGVGLCQVGAYGLAARGSSYKDILKTYYTGIEIWRR